MHFKILSYKEKFLKHWQILTPCSFWVSTKPICLVKRVNKQKVLVHVATTSDTYVEWGLDRKEEMTVTSMSKDLPDNYSSEQLLDFMKVEAL